MFKPDFIKQLNDLMGESENFEGISVSCLYKVEYNEKTESHIFHLNSVIRNEGDKEISAVVFEVDFINGEQVLHTSTEFWNGVDKAIIKGKSVNYEGGFQSRLEGKPEKISVRIKQIKDTVEQPLIHLPLPGEYLYQAINDEHINKIKEDLPVTVTVSIGNVAGTRQQKIDDPEQIRQLVELFSQIQIGGQTYMMATDCDNALFFEFIDGYKYPVRFNMGNLELNFFHRYYMYTLVNNRIFG